MRRPGDAITWRAKKAYLMQSVSAKGCYEMLICRVGWCGEGLAAVFQ
jgi:hypothetical protein